MKNNFFTWKALTCFPLLMALNLYSANAQNKTWSAGPEAGISVNKFAGDVEQQEFKNGFVGGAHITYSTKSTFGITFKALYHQRGSQQTFSNVINKKALAYLELPLLARFFLTTSGRFRPNLFVGPSASFLLGVKNKVGDGDYVKPTDQDQDSYATFDLGLTAGLGLNYLIAKETRLLFDARYNYGLLDIHRPELISFYNRGLAFTLGLSFGLNKQPLK